MQSDNPNGRNEQKMESIMGSLLRIGVLAAAVLVILGGGLFFVQHPHEIISYSTFTGEPSRLRHVNEILQQALSMHGRAVIQLGLLLLIATPVARVFFSLVVFAIEKDSIYICITLLVFVILMYSIFGY